MKTFKILGIAIATLGIAASIGGATALIIKEASEGGFGIGQGSYQGSEGAITYKINGNTSGSVAPKYYTEGNNPEEGPALTETYNQVKYEFTLGASFSNDLPEQNYVHGNLALAITNIPEEYRGKLSIWAGIEGYESGKAGERKFKNCFGGDVAITNDATSYEKDADISVAANGSQKLVVWVKYQLSDLDYIALNEKSLGYALNVTWKKATGDVAYVVGSGNGWEAHDEYAMAYNIGANWDDDEWIYNSLVGGNGWAQGKCKIGEVWSEGSDAELENGTTYDIYWKGAGQVAYFTPRGNN